MYSKHLISVTALFLSAACSSNPPDEGTGGSSGSGGSSGRTGTGGTQPSSGGTGGTTGGTVGSGGAGGTTGGTVGSGGAGGTTGGTVGSGGSAGLSTGGAGGTGGTTGGTVGSGGSGTGGASPMGGVGGTTGGTGGSGGRPGSGGAPGGGRGGMGAGGSAGTGAGGSAGMSGGSGGSGGGTAAKCDNLTLAPKKSGVARPSGAVGGLKVLDWAGFPNAVSFTFDDNNQSQMDDYAQLKAAGGHYTWFVIGNKLSSNSAQIAQYKATLADGQEIANHTYTHSSNGSQSDLTQAETFITQTFGVTAASMAAPNCSSSWASVAPSVLFQNRGPCGNPIGTVAPRSTAKTSPFQLPAYVPAANESSDTMNRALPAASDNQWRIYVIHGFTSAESTYQPVPIGNVTATISKAVMDGDWVEGMTNVGAYWQGQELIPTSATTSAKWTLPAKFPKNMCLRITTTGGTVTQNGQTIPWDDHGYYQISLDAGEVTIQ